MRSTNETTRDIVQACLLGPVAYDGLRKVLQGTGMVPGNLIGRVTWKRGVDDLTDTVKVWHASGGWSTLGMKSYEQGRGCSKAPANTSSGWMRKCPMDVYGECLIRLMTTQGVLLLTFTPLEGMTETVWQFQLSADQAHSDTSDGKVRHHIPLGGNLPWYRAALACLTQDEGGGERGEGRGGFG